MPEVSVAGLLASALVKIAGDKISSAIEGQDNFNGDLEDMKSTMESMVAMVEDVEKRSVKDESVRLWLKLLEHAALNISDMMDEYQDTQSAGKVRP